tara:strand:+ start:353 stop:685 length:333 start_codon:yes stop_codon:yes gene_type:complete
MRIWDKIEPSRLCRKHLLAEHRETLCIWSVITKNKKGYSKHPETVRYRSNLNALLYRHRTILNEAYSRGYHFKHLPNSNNILAFNKQPASWDNQEESLNKKECECIKHVR